MITLPLGEQLVEFVADPHDPVEGALLVASIIDGAADISWARGELDRLAHEIGPGDADHIVGAIRNLGFQGATEQYFQLDSSRLDLVLRNKRGIPISLAMVVMGVARRLGTQAVGVNFPRHFLLTLNEVLVDPFALETTSYEECGRWLAQNNIDPAHAFAAATGTDIALRMLNNVRMILHGAGEYVRALEISDYQLMIIPENYGLYLERAEIWMRLGDPMMVRQELERAVAFAPTAAIAERIRSRIGEIGSADVDLN